jgi:serine/threonine-protein kinase
LARIAPRRPLEPAVQGKPKRRHRTIWWLLAIVLVLTGGGGGAYWYFQYGPGSLVAVPQLDGLDQADAEAKIDAAELAARVKTDYSDDVVEGRVIKSSPAAGDRVKPGSFVDLLVSRGVRQATVPESGVVGESVATAEVALEEAELDGEVIQDLAYHTTIAAGLVLSVDPPGGSEVPHNRAITLLVSQGPEPAEVPDLRGMDLERAKEKAAALEMTVVEGEPEHSDDVAEGLIISQTPNADDQSHRGAEVTVVISLGLPFVTVPDLSDKSYEEAAEELTREGLVPKKNAPLGELWGRVYTQDPPAGRSVRKGTTVTVTVV